MPLTHDDATALWQHMSERYGSRIVTKATPEWRAVGDVLSAAGIVGGDDFMRSYATTIGDTIAVPWPDDFAGWTPWDRVLLCVHEHTHVLQSRRGPVQYVADYLRSPGRARLEAEAYATELEMTWLRRLKVTRRQIDSILDRLVAYALHEDDLDAAGMHLVSVARSLRNGNGPQSETAQVAGYWLQHRVQGWDE